MKKTYLCKKNSIFLANLPPVVELTPGTVLIENYEEPIVITARVIDYDLNDVVVFYFSISADLNYTITNQSVSSKEKVSTITYYPKSGDHPQIR